MFVFDDALLRGRWPARTASGSCTERSASVAASIRERGGRPPVRPGPARRGAPAARPRAPRRRRLHDPRRLAVRPSPRPGRRAGPRGDERRRPREARPVHPRARRGRDPGRPPFTRLLAVPPRVAGTPAPARHRRPDPHPGRRTASRPSTPRPTSRPSGIWASTGPTADPPYLMLRPGEPAARRRLQRWLDDGIADYAQTRDQLIDGSTSRLSQDLRWGLLSPLEVVERAGGGGEGRRDFHPGAGLARLLRARPVAPPGRPRASVPPRVRAPALA